MDQTAEDESERQRNRAKLYAPPAGWRPAAGERVRVPGAGMNRAQAQALAAQLSAEDARLAGRRSG